MKDDALILAAWAEATREHVPAILATVVKVAGSSYRSPGARMLITGSGGRTGSVSGGCLEGDLLKKAWWLAGERGSALRVYDNSSEEDAIWEFGLGCNGVVHVLIERWDAGTKPLTAELLEACRDDRRPAVLATVIGPAENKALGEKLAIFPDGSVRGAVNNRTLTMWMEDESKSALRHRESAVGHEYESEIFVEYIAPSTPLVIVGAGHDTLPLVRFAKELGWHVTVVDGRSNQARPERFALADRVIVADLQDDPLRDLEVDDQTVAVLMSHSYAQDSVFLKALANVPVRYLGVLGPRKRTDRMLSEAGLSAPAGLHSPIGLDLGAETPEEIALAAVSEVQAVIAGREGGMLQRRSGPIHEGRVRLETRPVSATA